MKGKLIAIFISLLFVISFSNMNMASAQAPIKKPQRSSSNVQSSSNLKVSGSHTGEYGGHEWVDLGLPSGLKWATCNVGANSPEEYGDYFDWGETTAKPVINTRNSETGNKDLNWLHNNGYLDENNNLTMQHDAARQQWGDPWRLPTAKEIQELVKYTTTKWTIQNGVYGRVVTSKRNGAKIFLPAAGHGDKTSVVCAGELGYYWSSTPLLEGGYIGLVQYLVSYEKKFRLYQISMGIGQSVRPVAK